MRDRLFRNWHRGAAIAAVSLVGLAAIPVVAAEPTKLPKTELLTGDGDFASQIVDGTDKYLLGKIDQSVERRVKFWNRDFSSPAAYAKLIEPNRARLAKILGAVGSRVTPDGLELKATTAHPALLAKGSNYEIFAVTWPAFGDMRGEGLLLVPTGRAAVADVVAIPDCNNTPEQLVGLSAGIPEESQFARRLAESGCRVIVPVLINRENVFDPQRGQSLRMSNREWAYRQAYEMGRGLIGYEVQKVLALVDWLAADAAGTKKIGIIGWGEGGLLALYSGALDGRVTAVCSSGYFDSRNDLWQEPIDRNVFGLLEQFGDAELASMICAAEIGG